MTGLIAYFTSVIATVLIGVVVTELIKEPRLHTIVQMILGVLVLLVLLRPIATVKPEALMDEIEDLFREEIQLSEYEALYQDKLREQVKSLTEEYIRKKGESMNASIRVQAELSTEGYPVPEKVLITGILTWEQRQSLEEYITQEFGIPQENQRWELYDS